MMGRRQCACGVWMHDDERPHCSVCENARKPHLAMRNGECVWVQPETETEVAK